jgi:alkylation response protein AidB-like acyl-CoA dehydrogenase
MLLFVHELSIRYFWGNSISEAPKRVDQAIASLELDSSAFSRSSLAQLDRTDSFPEDACRVLNELGVYRYYVPSQYGGKLDNHPCAHELMRTIAARDLTVAIAHGKTYLGAVCVWVDGQSEQQSFLAKHILDGGLIAWGLTEREHGSDLTANEVSATRNGTGWRVEGEKWLINNATRAELICLLARTDPRGGPHGHSLFLIDKRTLPPKSWRCLSKVRTYGIRGADISGIALSGALVPLGALVGDVGKGLYTVVRSLQLTRTACTALSLGAADHAFTLVHEFLDAQRAMGVDLRTVAHVRRRLGRAAASFLVAEATAILAGRCIHALPGEMSVVSAVAKSFVSTATNRLFADLSRLFGPYGILRGTFADGAFIKLAHDNRIVGIFDGSTPVCRAMLVPHLAKLANGYGAAWDRAGLTAVAAADTQLSPFDPARLELTSAQSSVVASFPAVIADMEHLFSTDLCRLAKTLETATAMLHLEMQGSRYPAHDIPAYAFVMMERYELCFAAVACLLMRRFSLARSSGDLALRACLVYVLEMLGEPLSDEDLGTYDRLGVLAFAPRAGQLGQPW